MNRFKRALIVVAMSIMALGANAYPWLSPYAYCMNNPVKFVDPDGRDNYTINAEGHVSLQKKTEDKFDIITARGNKIQIGKGIATQLIKTNEDNISFATINSKSTALALFKFVADNTKVEWGVNGYQTKHGTRYLLKTSHKKDAVTTDDAGFKMENLIFAMHSHPNGPDKASGFFKNSVQNGKDYKNPQIRTININTDVDLYR